ncbi:hypothetical protein PBI_DEWDROP_70 [Microbacterium phage Dewdrop]|nr:hypothetical protein PBI_LEAF_70 [Microbacterium phage Leaf]QGZ17525.1 hypothetical protein PBI_DEWDROP_70 [Microbacterium phage Dewdrop]
MDSVAQQSTYAITQDLRSVDGQYCAWARDYALDPTAQSTVDRYHRWLDSMV